jgi:peroxiredoxin
MALTGEYDVVAEVGMGVLNAVLGAVHENQDTAYPTMPHSMTIVVDDAPRGPGDPVPESQRTGIRSRAEVNVSTPIASLPVDTIVVGPVVDVMASARSAAVDAHPDRASVVGIRIPPILFDDSGVSVKVRFRAWVRDPTSDRLPEFLDGDLHVTMGLVRSEVAGVGTFVTLDRTSGPLVAFQPAPGTTVTDEQRAAVATVVRNFIRSDVDPPTFKVALPPEVRHFDFKLLPGARRPAVALMLVLSDRAVGPGAPAGVGPGFLPDGADVAVAIGREFVTGALRGMFEGLPGVYRFSKWGVSATLRPDWAGASFDFRPGRIVFSLRGNGSISWWGVDDSFSFTVELAFGLRVVGGRLEPFAIGDPVVDLDDVAVGGGYLEGKARSAIKDERDRALAAGAGLLGQAVDLPKQLATILAGVNPRPAGVTLTGVEIRTDGVVVPVRVGLAASAPVVVARTSRGGLDDAVDSWIPGGSIDRFVWNRFPARFGSERVEEHRFVTGPISTGVFGAICVRVEGTRVTAGGGSAPVASTACFVLSPVLAPLDDLSAEQVRPLVPLTVPGDRGPVVTGHLDPWGHGRVPVEGYANLLVHVAGEHADEAVKGLASVLKEVGDRAAVVAVAVVPCDALARATKVAASVEGLVVVDDPGGAWGRALGVDGAPATVLVGRSGAVVWRDGSPFDQGEVAAAVLEHAVPGGRVAAQPVTLAVRPGSRVPDVLLPLAHGSELSLRRLRGRPAVVVFWTSRSAPSIEHLCALRDRHAAGAGPAPLTIAVGDGETADEAERVAKDHRLPFVVLPDPGRRIASAFGVWCWPATVLVGADGRVESVDLGASAG